MATDIDALSIRKAYGVADWLPPEQYGPDGWRMIRRDRTASLIATVSDFPDSGGVEWLHASYARTDRMPDYADLTMLHLAVFRRGYAVQIFVPEAEHVNIHEYALHLWGRIDGKRPEGIPDFGRSGTI